MEGLDWNESTASGRYIAHGSVPLGRGRVTIARIEKIGTGCWLMQFGGLMTCTFEIGEDEAPPKDEAVAMAQRLGLLGGRRG